MMLDLGGTTWCWTETESATHGAKDDRTHTLENLIIPVISHETFPNRLISWVSLVLRGRLPVSQPWLWNRYWMRRDSR